MVKRKTYIATIAFSAALIGFVGCGSSSSSGGISGWIVPNGINASVVIGQPDFNTSSSGTTANKMRYPYGNAYVDGSDRLYLPDYGNARELVYNAIPTENNASADYALGQVDLNSSASGSGASEMSGPQTVTSFDGKLLVTDYSDNRVVIYNSIPTSGPGTGDVVVGQEDFNLSGNSCAANRLHHPETIAVTNGKLIVTDSGNNRVLIYNTIPTENNASADLVLGQDNFTSCAVNKDGNDTNASASSMYYPAGVWSDGNKLVIDDADNNRVLIWNTFPTTNDQPADIVLGQSDFNMTAANDDNQDGTEDGNCTARTLSFPYDGVFSNGTQLFVADSDNNRVLVWKTFPTQNFQPADMVIGQLEMNASDNNTTINTLSFPTGVLLLDNKLIVTDEGNNRCLIYEK